VASDHVLSPWQLNRGFSKEESLKNANVRNIAIALVTILVAHNGWAADAATAFILAANCANVIGNEAAGKP
jgi:hypothetical protein